MKKRFLSLLCVLALCLGLLPVTALAVENAPAKLYVGNCHISNNDTITYLKADSTSEGSLTSGNETDWTVKYEPSTATLTLKNATIKGDSNTDNSSGAGIYAVGKTGSDVALTIKLEGTSTVSGVYGVYVQANQDSSSGGNSALLTISGNGTLTATGSSSYGIAVSGYTGGATLTIENASVDAKTTSAYSYYAGVYVQSSAYATNSSQLSLAVHGGSLTASGSASSDGILFYVGSSSATNPTTKLTVGRNAIVDAKSGGISATALNAGDISDQIVVDSDTGNSGGIVFDGMEGTVYGNVTLQDELEIKRGETLTVPAGSSLNCNGKLTNSGTILVSGGNLTGNLSGGTTPTRPNITGQPTDKTVTAGNTATFTVTASDVEGVSLTFQWQQSTDSGSSWTAISGATSATYTTAATTTGMNNYQYRCMVKNTIGVGVISQAATLTVNQLTIYTISADVTPVNAGTVSGSGNYAAGDTVTLTATPNSGYRFVGWVDGSGQTVNSDTVYSFSAANSCRLTAQFARISTGSGGSSTSSKTPSQQAADKIASAKDGATVEITLKSGQTKLDKEVFEELAGRDVTLQISLPGGVMWTVNGEDIPADADLTDLDLGVTMDTDGIPASVFNAITGETGTVQLTLAHDGEFGFALTLTAPLGKDYADLWANLYHYDEDAGKLVFQTAARIGADGTADLRFTHASEYAIVIDDRDHTPKAFPFADVRETDWFYDAVDFVFQNELMNGTSGTTFAPDGTMTRAMLVTILHRQAGEPVVNYAMPFDDVTEGTWYSEAVRWAAAEGIVTGTSATTFAPDAPITREQFAAILYRYAQSEGQGFTGAWAFRLDFDDADAVSEYAYEAMCWLTMHGVIEGSGGNLNPQDSATRAEAAKMLMRFVKDL